MRINPMKIITKFLVVLGVLGLVTGFAAQAHGSQSPKHRDLEVWIDAKVGSHLGSGYASSYLTDIRARTIEMEDPKLRNAIDSLDGLGMLPVRGFGLVPAAVSWLTETHIHTLVEQQAETRLSYGELLIAHSLAAKSKESFAHIVAMRAKTRTWGELANQLQIDPEFLVTRANVASSRIRDVDSWTRRPSRGHDTSLTRSNPHAQTARLR
jgi:hypothetical protein